MGLLTPKGKKGDKNNKKTQQGGTAKPLNSKLKSSGFGKKQLPGSAQRGS